MKMLFDFYMRNLKEETGISDEHPEYEGISFAIKEAMLAKRLMELYARDGMFAGFLTWEVRQNQDNPQMVDLGITNLLILKRAAGTYCLQRATNKLRAMYPNTALFIWKNRKTGKTVIRRQRGIHETIQTAVHA